MHTTGSTRTSRLIRPRAFLVTACASALLVAACGSPEDISGQAAAQTTAEQAAGSTADTSPATSASQDRVTLHYTEGEQDWDPTSATEITLAGDSASSTADNVVVDGSTVTITASGTYVVSGRLTDGSLVVASAADGLVRIVLDGADVASTSGPALEVVAADEVVVVLADGSTNSLEGGAESSAALDSTADLTIAGTGVLAVDGAVNDGIASSDGLVVVDATIDATAVDDGLRGKDYLVVQDAVITVDAGGDGLVSDNADDPARGFLTLTDATLDVDAGGDGVQAETDLDVTGGDLTVRTGGGSGQTVAEDASAKGLKAGTALVIDGGTLDVDATDDALHANDTVTVLSGDLTLATGDDGIHADTALTVTAGTIDVTESYEGLESAMIAIDGGDISIRSSDDGINVSSGEDASEFGPDGGAPPGGPGVAPGGLTTDQAIVEADGATTRDEFTDTGEQSLTITGGTIVVDADGDGLDANGAFVMTGGSVLVHGPTMQGNGALDARSITVNGGVLLAAGSAGMAETPGTGSTQAWLGVRFGTAVPAGSTVTVTTDDGAKVATFTTVKATETLVVSTPDLVSASSYTVAVEGTVRGSLTAS